MEPHANIEAKLEAIETKLAAIQTTVDKTKRYLQIITWVTIAMVVLPLIGLVFAVPIFISTYLGAFAGL